MQKIAIPLFILTLVLAACGTPAVAAPDTNSLPDPNTTIDETNATGILILVPEQTGIVNTEANSYAIYFEEGHGIADSYSGAWSKWDSATQQWSPWTQFTLGWRNSLFLPTGEIIDSLNNHQLEGNDLRAGGLARGRSICLFDGCLVNDFELWLNFQGGGATLK